MSFFFACQGFVFFLRLYIPGAKCSIFFIKKLLLNKKMNDAQGYYLPEGIVSTSKGPKAHANIGLCQTESIIANKGNFVLLSSVKLKSRKKNISCHMKPALAIRHEIFISIKAIFELICDIPTKIEGEWVSRAVETSYNHFNFKKLLPLMVPVNELLKDSCEKSTTIVYIMHKKEPFLCSKIFGLNVTLITRVFWTFASGLAKKKVYVQNLFFIGIIKWKAMRSWTCQKQAIKT